MKEKFTGESGAGLVKITLNYFGKADRIEIDDLIFKKTDKELISDLFVAALNDALNKFDIAVKEQMMKIYSKRSPADLLPPGIDGFKN